MFRLANPVQHYPWGSTTEMPRFCGFLADGRPHAELWIGAHPSAPSVAVPATPVAATASPADVAPVCLDMLVASDAESFLGEQAVATFGERLPFLVKLLAAGAPLSLQVHPSADHARVEYARQAEADVPADERNYADDQHKPELLVALAPTVALAGFRDPQEAATNLEQIAGPGVDAVIAALRGSGSSAQRVRAGFAAALALPGEAVAGAIERIRAQAAHDADREPGISALDIASMLIEHHQDPGVVASFLLNAVHLEPGEGLYVGAGVVHAYVRGFGLEVMAASDNVLRAGLTVKRVDVPELMAIVDTAPAPAHLIRPPADRAIRSYDAPVADFHLDVIDVGQATGLGPGSISSAGPRLVVCLAGVVSAETDGGRLALTRGESAFVAAADGAVRFGGSGTVALVGVGRENVR